MEINDVVDSVGKSIDALGVAVMLVGIVAALVAAAVTSIRERLAMQDTYRDLRRRIGRSVLLGLELLVAGDIIRTVAVTPTFRSVGVLGLIVLIRTFLSFTLEVEISGHWPWQRE
jgi:uncharacterized membrane protein